MLKSKLKIDAYAYKYVMEQYKGERNEGSEEGHGEQKDVNIQS